jgi:hypothetical protein
VGPGAVLDAVVKRKIPKPLHIRTYIYENKLKIATESFASLNSEEKCKRQAKTVEGCDVFSGW